MMALPGAGRVAAAGSRTSVGRSTPEPIPDEVSRSRPARADAGAVAAVATASGSPRFSAAAGAMRTPSTASAPAAAQARCATTPRAMRVHSGLSVRAGRRRGHSSLGPIESRTTGSKVADTTTLISGMSMAASPMLRRNGTVVSASAARLTVTVMPENKTARPAVAVAVSTAAWLSRPLPRSSRHRVTMSSA